MGVFSRMTSMTLTKAVALVLLAAGGEGSPPPGEAFAAKLNVVATTPDLGALVREIGGDAVTVTVLAKPTEDPHFVDAKPGLIVTLNRADVLVDGGAELEIGWLPALLESARNPRIAAGAPGRVSASSGIQLIEIPATFDRSRGDVHALGNPHFLVDPVNAKVVAGQLAAHLSQVAPQLAPVFHQNLGAFNARLDRQLAEWEQQLAPFAGAKIVTYHRDFQYFARRFKLEVVQTLEPKPGIAPSPAHITEVIKRMRADGTRVILVQPFQNKRTAETVARQTGATVLEVSHQPGSIPSTATYFELMDSIVNRLAAALTGRS
jgi:ABC-type Zn uptake system ZnuABC Zn-binding protein ZnuA